MRENSENENDGNTTTIVKKEKAREKSITPENNENILKMKPKK